MFTKIGKLTRRTGAIMRSWRFMGHLEKLGGRLVPYPRTRVCLGEGSRIVLRGTLRLGVNAMGDNGRSTLLRMDENSLLEVDKDFSLFYGGDVTVFAGGKLKLGRSFINSDCRIRCHESICIGDGCAISHDVTIMDSDAHRLNGSQKTDPVIIRDHVWIGSRVLILSGVTVGEGAVVAAGSVVTKNVPARSLVGGVPARVLREEVTWSL